MRRYTKRRSGGMLKQISSPLGKTIVTIGKAYGNDYLQKKSMRVINGAYEDPSLLKNPNFVITGNKPMKTPSVNISYENKENSRPSNTNIQPNLGGGKRRKYKKTNKNRKYKK